MKKLVLLATSLAIIGAAPREAAAEKVKIKLGTLAPEGSLWHVTLQKMAQRWAEASKGEVELKIYPGGVSGDEGDMVRKIRVGQLHAGTMTGIGLGLIARSAVSLQIPMMIESWDELDYIRERVGPRIEKDMGDQGFVVLNWGDAGWVHHFSKVQKATAEEFKKLKMFVWNGDPESEQAWRVAGFTPVPLSATDVTQGLKTGLIEVVGTTPIYALGAGWFTTAKYMVRLNWAPLNGGTVVKKDQWEKIDPALRPKLLQIAQEEGAALRKAVRELNDKAVKTMQEKGLVVHDPTPGEIADWKAAAESAYAFIRGKVVAADLFDQILALRKEFRAKKK